MCGIAGLLTPGQGLDEGTLRRVTAAMSGSLAHRGPDAEGFWFDPAAGIGLGHRRLSIIDLSPAGAQPMTSADGRWVLTYNGEFYNYQDVRRALDQRRSIAWRGHSDSEVLVEAIATFGVAAALERVNGMFAFALWDRDERVLWLARDRMGEKPLYYGWAGRCFGFASELRAFGCLPDAGGLAIDRDAAASYLRFGNVPAPRSIRQGIGKLLPGHLARLPLAAPIGTAPAVTPYWSARAVAEEAAARPFAGDAGSAADALEALLVDAVRIRMVSDVPLGAFLSGGIDSSTVAAIVRRRLDRPLRTYTIGFKERAQDEAPFARAIADHLGTAHEEFTVDEAEALSVVPMLGSLYDEPFADTSQIPTYLLARLARRHVIVALSGDGGDELFAGYPRQWQAAERWRRLAAVPLPLRRLLDAAAQAVPAEAVDEALAWTGGRRGARLGSGLRRQLAAWGTPTVIDLARASLTRLHRARDLMVDPPAELPADGGQDPGAAALDDPLKAILFCDSQTYLPDMLQTKIDRATMAVSLEARAPLLDHRIAAFAWSLPPGLLRGASGAGKQPLRDVLRRHVPEALFERPKQGFDPPIAAWLRGPLRDWAEALLSPTALAQGGVLRAAPVRRRWQQLQAGYGGGRYQLWSLIMLQAWLLGQRAAGAAAPSAAESSRAGVR